MNETLVGVMDDEDLVLNVPHQGRYLLEFKNAETTYSKVMDPWDNDIVYCLFKRSSVRFTEITAEEAQNYFGQERKRIVLEGAQVPHGLPLPEREDFFLRGLNGY